MISFASPLPIGNAVLVIVVPPQGVERWIVTRKLTNDFTGWNDPAAGVVADSAMGSDIRFTDTSSLVNGTAYFYQEFDTVDGSAWTGSPVISATPASSYETGGPDVLALIRDRIEAVMNAAIAAGKIKHKNNAMPVLTAPPEFDQTAFPMVTVHLRNDVNNIDAIGQGIDVDTFDLSTGDWVGSEGWLSRVDIQVIAWALNPDERIFLRNLIKAGIAGNFAVFDAAGMVNIDIGLSDIEDFETYGCPVYQTVASIGCDAPFVVSGRTPAVAEIDVTATGIAAQLSANFISH